MVVKQDCCTKHVNTMNIVEKSFSFLTKFKWKLQIQLLNAALETAWIVSPDMIVRNHVTS